MQKLFFLLAILLGSLTSCTKENAVSNDFTTTLDARGSGTPISIASIPQPVKDYITTKYPGYRIKEAQQELEHGAIEYKVTIINGRLKKRLLFDASWVFIGEKL